jgi:hypothetical protein
MLDGNLPSIVGTSVIDDVAINDIESSHECLKLVRLALERNTWRHISSLHLVSGNKRRSHTLSTNAAATWGKHSSSTALRSLLHCSKSQ